MDPFVERTHEAFEELMRSGQSFIPPQVSMTTVKKAFGMTKSKSTRNESILKAHVRWTHRVRATPEGVVKIGAVPTLSVDSPADTWSQRAMVDLYSDNSSLV